MANQDDNIGQSLSLLIKAAAKVLADDGSLNRFHDTCTKFFVKLSPHVIMQDMETAPKDRPILALLSVDETPLVVKWVEYDKNDAVVSDLMEGVPETGFWCPEENLIADVMGAADPVGWWELPTVQSIAKRKKESDDG